MQRVLVTINGHFMDGPTEMSMVLSCNGQLYRMIYPGNPHGVHGQLRGGEWVVADLYSGGLAVYIRLPTMDERLAGYPMPHRGPIPD